MKTSANRNKRLEIRISEEDLKLFKVAAYCVGLKSSQLIRMFVDSTINAFKIKIKNGEINLADYETILND